MTAQLAAWKGQFGNDYTERNTPDKHVIEFLAKFWRKINIEYGPANVLEVGANIGRNLRAMQEGPTPELFALEPNELARHRLVKDGVVQADHIVSGVAQKIDAEANRFDMVLTSGVLIHVPPDTLLDACNEIYRVSKRLICCMEYYADEPETKPYRGHDGLLFKRDFGAYWLDNYPLKVLDYGFLWKRATPIDNLTWWLMEKQ